MADGRSMQLETEDRYRLLIESITDYAIYMLDPHGFVASWNTGAQRVKGYTVQEIVGQHFSRFYTEEDIAAGEPARGLEAARRDGRFEKEGWRVRKDGSRFWANIVLDAIRDEHGHLLGYAKITRDISEKRAAQLELAKAREELFQAQKMEAIGQLTGGIAHDFNNLLMAIMGSLQMLQKRLPDSPQITPLINNALHGAERGAALTQRLLAFSRRQELDMGPVNLPAVVEQLLELVRRSLTSTTHIETHFDHRAAWVLTDPNQLETALLNLVVNARDAMPEGGTIRITTRMRKLALPEGKLPPGVYVDIAVSDEGEGMDAETTRRATTPFFTTKGIGKGTGLGLSMVQGLTEQSGGELRILSAPDMGTTVTLILPATTGPLPQADIEESPMSLERTEPSRPLTILAVDDDALVLMNTTLMLEDLGHSVIEAYDGQQALEIVESGRSIDIVITDHAMPKMSGAELAARLRSAHPDLPVVLATGYAELPTGEGAHLPRLPKPFSQAQLRDVIGAIAPPA